MDLIPKNKTKNSLVNPAKYKAVILAGGNGSRLLPYTLHENKSLLPIANKPLIFFQLQYAYDNNLGEALLVVKPEAIKTFNDYVDTVKDQFSPMKIKVVANTDDSQAQDNRTGTADALRHVADEIGYTNDFIVIPGDFISNFPLHDMLLQHNLNQATITSLYQDTANLTPFHMFSDKPEDTSTQVLAIDINSNRLVDVRMKCTTQHLSIPKVVMKNHPRVQIKANYQHTHIYIFSPSILNLLKYEQRLSSIQTDLVPYITASQFIPDSDWWVKDAYAKRQLLNRGETIPEEDTFENVTDAKAVLTKKHENLTKPSFSYRSSSRVVTNDDWITVYAHVVDKMYFIERANTIPSYLAINFHFVDKYEEYSAYKFENHTAAALLNAPTASLTSAIVGENLVLEPSTVKFAVIGKNCRVEKGCRVNKSILMDNVSVGAGAHLFDCVIGNNVVIPPGVSLKKCKVPSNTTIPADKGPYENVTFDSFDSEDYSDDDE